MYLNSNNNTKKSTSRLRSGGRSYIKVLNPFCS